MTGREHKGRQETSESKVPVTTPEATPDFYDEPKAHPDEDCDGLCCRPHVVTGREPSAHRLTELLTRDDLRSATGTTPWRSWRCSCGAVGSGYRWSSDIDLANEWGEHVAREATREVTDA